MSHSHSHDHPHGHEHRAHEYRAHESRVPGHGVLAAAPTFSLLRLSVLQRLAGAAILLSLLWLLVFWVMG